MKDRIKQLLEKSDWTLVLDQDNIKMMQFQNGLKKINVYWGTMTVVVAPGRSEMQPTVLRDVDLDVLRGVFGIKKKWWNLFK